MKAMKILTCLTTILGCASAFAPNGARPSRSVALRMSANDSSVNKFADYMKVSAATLATVLTLQGGLMQPLEANAAPPAFTSNVVAEKTVRQGIYKEYEVDLVQEVDDARSTFKSTKETKSKKGKYTALIAVTVVGSFVIPMAQYFWYVRDDDSSDRFFNQQKTPPPPPPPKKKGFFGKK
uniref:Uncharacterized protein n=1 Tax=Corethron hystrix TaxID=216773 RepID=A0A7S1BGW7_9STRA